MSDETSESSSAVDTIEAPPVEAAPVPVAPAEPVPFWHRPNVVRYLSPLITPILVILGLVVYVLNISRVFLSGHGHIPVVVGSIITALILLGATVLANSSRLRAQSITLMTVGFLFVMFCAGWLVLGSSQEKGGGTTPLAGGKYTSVFEISALPSIKFSPTEVTVPTGVYLAELKGVGAGHTLNFDDPKTLFAGVQVDAAGQVKSSRIFFGEPGDYTYFCAIPGHRATMNGVVHVTGSPMTLAQAEAKGKLTGPAA